MPCDPSVTLRFLSSLMLLKILLFHFIILKSNFKTIDKFKHSLFTSPVDILINQKLTFLHKKSSALLNFLHSTFQKQTESVSCYTKNADIFSGLYIVHSHYGTQNKQFLHKILFVYIFLQVNI